MKKQLILITGIIFILTCVFPLIVSAKSQNTGREAEPPTISGPARHVMPEGKQEAFERIQARLEKEYNVCMEHCGYATDCQNRCENVYNNLIAESTIPVTTPVNRSVVTIVMTVAK